MLIGYKRLGGEKRLQIARPVKLVDLPFEVLPDRGEVIHLLDDLLKFASWSQFGVRDHAFCTGGSRGVTDKMLEALAIELVYALLPSVFDVLAEDFDWVQRRPVHMLRESTG